MFSHDVAELFTRSGRGEARGLEAFLFYKYMYILCTPVGLEVVGPSKRIWTGMFVQVFFAIGEMYLALVAYLIREWKWINLACAIPCVIYLTYWW